MVFLVGHNRYKSSHVDRTGFGEIDKRTEIPCCCRILSVNKLGGSGGMVPQENFKIRHSEMASEAMFGPKKLLEYPHL